MLAHKHMPIDLQDVIVLFSSVYAATSCCQSRRTDVYLQLDLVD